MKVDAKVIEALNKLLKNEFTAINQYILHSAMCLDWGYTNLGEKYKQDSDEELQDARKIIDRILFLGGKPIVKDIGSVTAGDNVKHQFELNLNLELSNIKDLNESVNICSNAGDPATRLVLERVILHEEEHVEWFERQLLLIDDVGIENYLAANIVKNK